SNSPVAPSELTLALIVASRRNVALEAERMKRGEWPCTLSHRLRGSTGSNYQKAVAAFQDANAIKPSGNLDPQTWERLTATASDPVLVEYEIQPADVKGPFNKTIPPSLEKKAELKTLNFTGPRELLAEKFHIDPALLTRLNP